MRQRGPTTRKRPFKVNNVLQIRVLPIRKLINKSCQRCLIAAWRQTFIIIQRLVFALYREKWKASTRLLHASVLLSVPQRLMRARHEISHVCGHGSLGPGLSLLMFHISSLGKCTEATGTEHTFCTSSYQHFMSELIARTTVCRYYSVLSYCMRQ